MAVPFNNIPGTLRAPLFYVEVDRSAANQGGAEVLRTLLVGQRILRGTPGTDGLKDKWTMTIHGGDGTTGAHVNVDTTPVTQVLDGPDALESWRAAIAARPHVGSAVLTPGDTPTIVVEADIAGVGRLTLASAGLDGAGTIDLVHTVTGTDSTDFVPDSGQGDADALTRIVSASQVGKLFGVGSMLHRMAVAYFAGDAMGEVWAIALDDDDAAAKATATIKVNAVATKAGILPLYVDGKLVKVGIAKGLTKAQTIAAITAAVAAPAGDKTLPCTITDDSTDTGTLTARNGGKVAGKLDVRACYLGSAAGEELPEGLSLTITNFSGGDGDPDVTAAIDAMGDEPFEFIAWPYTFTTQLDAIRDELDDTSTGRWGPFRQLYGHAIGFQGNDAGGLASWGADRNDGHAAVLGLKGVLDSWAEVTAALVATVAGSVRVDPARPLQTLPIATVKVPAIADRFDLATRDAQLHGGVATAVASAGGILRIERLVTTYQKNAFGDPDASLLDSETLFTLAAIMRRLKGVITSNFPRHKLVSDGTKVKPGSAVVTPSLIRALLVNEYRRMETDGLVENVEAFKQFLVVERNSQDPGRVDVLFPPDLANALRIFAVLNQFRLQYPAPLA